MEDNEESREAEATITIVERRTNPDRELSSTEVMRLLRKRAAKKRPIPTESLAEFEEK